MSDRERRFPCTVVCIGCLPVHCLYIRECHLAVLQYKGGGGGGRCHNLKNDKEAS